MKTTALHSKMKGIEKAPLLSAAGKFTRAGFAKDDIKDQYGFKVRRRVMKVSRQYHVDIYTVQ